MEVNNVDSSSAGWGKAQLLQCIKYYQVCSISSLGETNLNLGYKQEIFE